MNVKGKRGNIVQTYPAVEYDFVPSELELSTNDVVHIQWTGSNSHQNGNPGGDGQTGDAGQGKTGTDRSNLVQISDMNENYPLPYEMTTMWKDANIIGYMNGQANLTNDLQSYLKPTLNSNDFKKGILVLLKIRFCSRVYFRN